MRAPSLGITLNPVFPDRERIFAKVIAAAAVIDRVVRHPVVPKLDIPCHYTNAARQHGEDKQVHCQMLDAWRPTGRRHGPLKCGGGNVTAARRKVHTF